jgi:site-specific DNA-methyltransferase (adenine-specific)
LNQAGFVYLAMLIKSDARHIPLADESVHCCVTSPPYWGLRDYSANGQLGLEPTPEVYVQHMVAVFREVRRVLRRDGTLWLNLGDTYCSQGGPEPPQSKWQVDGASNGQNGGKSRRASSNLKPKDLVGIPWRVAFALQADGWWLRSDIIWWKSNAMPESVTDRPAKAHDYLFLMAKSADYFYDAEAIAEPVSGTAHSRGNGVNPKCVELGLGVKQNKSFSSVVAGLVLQRNKRTVWDIATQAFSGAHFATFPEGLVQPCIAAGTSEHGCCPKCAAPFERITSSQSSPAGGGHYGRTGRWSVESTTIGWQPTCSCPPAEPVPCIVFDPFAGSGTVGLVAFMMGRRFVLGDLTYHELMRERIPPMAESFELQRCRGAWVFTPTRL